MAQEGVGEGLAERLCQGFPVWALPVSSKTLPELWAADRLLDILTSRFTAPRYVGWHSFTGEAGDDVA